jgi:hypothetical protein
LSTRPNWLVLLALFSLLALLGTACSGSKRVIVLVDGERRVVETQAATVGQVLREQNILLGDQDRVDPPDYTPIERTATIQIVRVALKTETVHEPIEFGRIYTREENLPEGQVRVSRLGANGEAEIDYQVTYEDGRAVSRSEIARRVLREPVNELLLIGTQGTVAPVELKGTLAYLAKGNAWIVRGSTADRRPLTTTGDLDGRVLDLSPDGKYLLFSRAVPASNPGAPNATQPTPTASQTATLNILWVIDTVPFSAQARPVFITDALYAQWAPDGSGRVAFTTGARTAGAPGWKAYNDLNIATLYGMTETLRVTDTDIQTKTVLVTPTPVPSDTPPPRATPDPNFTPDPNVPPTLPPPTYTPRPPGRAFTRTLYITSTRVTTLAQTANTPITHTNRVVLGHNAPAPYSWWGWNLAWSPDAKTFAYAFADQIGLIAEPDSRRPLEQFAYYDTRGDWVWEPQLAWSPDGRFVAATLHAPPNGAERAEDAIGFDLWLVARGCGRSPPGRRPTHMGKAKSPLASRRTRRAVSARAMRCT